MNMQIESDVEEKAPSQRALAHPVEDFLVALKPRLASNILLWGLLAFLVIFVIWASATRLDRSVVAQGRVIPGAQLQIISNLEGGIVAELFVKTGSFVAKNAPIVRLSPALSDAEFGSGQATVNALRAKIARLEAEILGKEPQYPAAADQTSAEQIKIEQALHVARMADLSAGQGAMSARLIEASRAVSEARANYAARASARDAARRQVAALRPLVEAGVEPRMTLTLAEGTAAVNAAEASGALSSISRLQASVSEAQALRTQQAQFWRSKAADELAAAQAELNAKSKTLPALADRAARTMIRAPLSGRINRILTNTIGGSVRPGEPIAELVPSDEGLLIEAFVSPQDIAFIRIEQAAKISLTAYDSTIYGSIQGKVVLISPDAIVNEKTGESHYLIRVRTNTTALETSRGQKLPIGVGMVASINLLGDKRSVMEYILSPISRLSERAFRE